MNSIKKVYKGTLFCNDVPFHVKIEEIKFDKILKYKFEKGKLRVYLENEVRAYKDFYSYQVEDNKVKLIKICKQSL